MILSEEHRMIRDMTQQFARDRLAPNAAQWEHDRGYPDEILKECGELGLFGINVPEEYDGAGMDYVSYSLALMEIAAGDGSLSTMLSVHNSPGCSVMMSSANEEQKQKYLKPMARGESISSFALTEPSAGSDAGALKTRAKKDGNGYIINGSKQFISNAKIGKCSIVFAVTDPDAGKKGLSAFIVDNDTPGFSVTSVEEKMGQKASDTCALSFEDMRISGDALLGNEGDGYRIALANLETGRIGIASQSIGMAQSALDYAIEYAKERETFNTPIIQHQAVGFRLAEMAAKLESARQLTLHAAALKDAKLPCIKEACMAKLVASEVAEEVCSAAIQTLGGYGYLSEYPVERIARDVRVCKIYEGTSDVQKLVINRALMS